MKIEEDLHFALEIQHVHLKPIVAHVFQKEETPLSLIYNEPFTAQHTFAVALN